MCIPVDILVFGIFEYSIYWIGILQPGFYLFFVNSKLFLQSFLAVVGISLMDALGFYPSYSGNGSVLSCCVPPPQLT